MKLQCYSNTLELTNTRKDGNRYIPEIIEYGQNYYNSALDARIGARPFMKETYNELSTEGKARDFLKEGLEKQLGTGTVI